MLHYRGNDSQLRFSYHGKSPKILNDNLIIPEPIKSVSDSWKLHNSSAINLIHGQSNQQYLQEQIKKQNQLLRTKIQNCRLEIKSMEQKNSVHESEIQSLLKFNERLLVIIETQLNQYTGNRSEQSYSLQPISQITERDSEYFDGVGPIVIKQHPKQHPIQKSTQQRYIKKGDGCETERLRIGEDRQQLRSYSGSQFALSISHNSFNKDNKESQYFDNLSAYQRQYKGYSPSQKLKQVLGLVAEYRKQYGQSAQQYEKMKNKIQSELNYDTQEIKKLENQSIQFIENRINSLNIIRDKIGREGVDKDICRILEAKQNGRSKYSDKIIQKLKSLINNN